MRAGCVHAPMAMAMTMLGAVGPVTLTKASARRKAGTVWNASVMRISTSSTMPPRNPASVPTIPPMPSAAAADATATRSEVRVP